MDTKKVYLDNFVRDFSSKPRTTMPSFLGAAQQTVTDINKVFQQRDPLLQQVGMVVLYYHLFRIAREQNWLSKVSRKKLLDFDRERELNRQQAEDDIGHAKYDLLEFDRFAQSPNDGYAIKFRLSILLKEVFKKSVSVDEL